MTRVLLATLAGLFAIPAAAQAGVLTSGTLTNAQGAPSAGTVRVYAFGLPSGNQKVFDSPLLGQATAAADGNYTVSTLDDGQLLRLARARDGYLDLVAIGDIAGARAVWNYTVKVTGTPGALTVVPAQTSTPERELYNLSQPIIPLHASFPAATTARAAQRDPCIGPQQTRKPVSVRKMVVVGELNNAYNDGTVGTFRYARQGYAQTAFTVSAEYPGMASVNFSGQTVTTNGGSATFPQAKSRYARKLRSTFEFTRYDVRRSPCAVWESEIRVTSWVGGTNSSLKQNRTLDRCDTSQVQGFEGGAVFTRDRNHAVRYDRAVEAFGINVSSQSGFSTNVQLDYKFGGSRSKMHYLCGEDGRKSPYESGRVFSGARK
jgi:hypothetical protein